MGDQQRDEVITLSPEETEARLLSSVILEFNDESLYLARDDRENLITFGDGQGKDLSIPFPEGERARWKQMRRFRNLLVHGVTRFSKNGSITIHPSQQWRDTKYDTEIRPFPNGLGRQDENVYNYTLDDMRGLAGLFRGMSLRNRLKGSFDAYWLCPSFNSYSSSVTGLERGSTLEFPCGLEMSYPDGSVLSNCKLRNLAESIPSDD